MDTAFSAFKINEDFEVPEENQENFNLSNGENKENAPRFAIFKYLSGAYSIPKC